MDYRTIIHLPPGKYRVYLRISQDQSGQEVGVDRQWDDLQPSLTSNEGVTVVEVYREPNTSATKENVVRKEFERLLREIQPDERIVCWHSDRFVRTTRDLLRVIQTKALVYALWSGYFDLSTPAGIAVAKTQIAWAEYEGQQKALRQKSSHQQRVRSQRPFLGGQRPFGFLKTEDSYEPEAAEASALRTVYDMILDGGTVTQGAEYLNSYGFTMNRGRPWNYNSLRQILVKPRYAGILTYHKEEVGLGNWTPIVDEDVFRAVVRLLNDPMRLTGGPRLGRGGVLHYLVPVSECGVCHGKIRGQSRNGHQLYQCRIGCASARAAWLEAKAAAVMIQRSRDRLAALEVKTPNLDALRAELRGLELEVGEYEAAKKTGRMTLAQFLDFNEDAQRRISSLRETVDAATVGHTLSEFLRAKDPVLMWMDKTPRERATLARAFFSKVEVLPRGKGGHSLEGKAAFHIKGVPEPIVA